MWNAVSRLENIGLKVLAFCCDGLSANRRFFRLHDAGSKEQEQVYRVVNPYAHEGEKRFIFFLSDPPHLMKTVRKGAPATFQRLVDRVLRGLEKSSGACIDNIIVFSIIMGGSCQTPSSSPRTTQGGWADCKGFQMSLWSNCVFIPRLCGGWQFGETRAI